MQQFKEIIQAHSNNSKRANTHPAKLLLLAELLKKLFRVQIEELITGIEKKLGSKILGLRGSADLIFSDVVFEIKVDLERELEDAKKQITKYLQVLHEKKPNRRHVAIATDCLEFRAFAPVFKGGKVNSIAEISTLNVSSSNTNEIVLWLDAFVFAKTKIAPSAQDLKYRFGTGSPTYTLALHLLTSLWEKVKDEEDVKLKFELWLKSLEIVYGSTPSVSAFIEQTYLVSLVKLIAYFQLSSEKIIDKKKLRLVLTGEYFSSYGIANLIEEDFFVWLLHKKISSDTLEFLTTLGKQLLRYDLAQIDEDFFKEIYQDILELGQRHRIGEYYTPEWLAQILLREALFLSLKGKKVFPSILDPSCGSGTFLTNAIQYAIKTLNRKKKTSEEIFDWIINNISGVDINPIAVIIARVNYLIALGNLLQFGKNINIPVWVADSIKLPEKARTFADVYIFLVENRKKGKRFSYSLEVPVKVANNRQLLNPVIAGFKEAIELYRKKKGRIKAIKTFQQNISHLSLSPQELLPLKMTLHNIFKFIDENRDSIWVFMLENIYVPITLMNVKFDLIIGNPPWISMRFIENPTYQDYLKKLALNDYNLLDSREIELFTQLECATIFFCRTAELYLKDSGVLAFVMPRSVITGALQHVNFKKFKHPLMSLQKIIDLGNVSPLFNVPGCALLAIKDGATSYPVRVNRYTGKLPEKNIKLDKARQYLNLETDTFEPVKTLNQSFYFDKVKAGAAIYPRCFYFIDFEVQPVLGAMDLKRPFIKTSADIQEKPPWKGTRFAGNVESQFIYATLLGGDIIPFGYIKLRPVVLPVELTTKGYRLLSLRALSEDGFTKMTEWVEEIQKVWEDKRTVRAEENFPTFQESLNYQSLLTIQRPDVRYVVIYNAAGKNLTACVIDKKALHDFSVAKTSIKPTGFVSDKKTWLFETDNENEAHYLCAILSSSKLNDAIKPLQTVGLFGERDIHRRPFLFPVPQFNQSDASHKRLADISKLCHKKVSLFTFNKRRVAAIRKEGRDLLIGEITEIDDLMTNLLGI